MASESGATHGRGLFVTLDGPSGVGKTTVSTLLGEQLASQGVPTLVTATPSPSSIGELARHGTHEFHGPSLTCLVAADRYHQANIMISPAVEQGTTVVCDRFVPSSLVLDPLDGIERGFVWDIYRKILVPDIAIVLMGDASLCATRVANRGRFSRFHGSDYEDHRREREYFTEALAFLRGAGYPAHEYDIGRATAREVAAGLAHFILAIKDGRS
ncbi:hypothetical protein BLA60_11610 [Actinophytocola xinjiangensis]|uniref:Thymidylate kinase n=1 Tax=Actinophytocola xinjiangensis TaxID=485602 RepID=A0A7Z0WPE5_9PSEU|nr:hypothetical protein [Actinophytocola xinjiangensis]OLF11586.1 hypothetical protein BLA60_11610 [Actinophytocola xinjiangensis]